LQSYSQTKRCLLGAQIKSVLFLLLFVNRENQTTTAYTACLSVCGVLKDAMSASTPVPV